MPIDSGNLALKGLDDLFSTEENRQEEQREQVQQIPIDALHPFTNHPFKVLDDEAMTRTVESIAQYGVLAPLIARPRPDGDGYEIISGHRRQYAAKLAGLDTLPVIVRQMSDDAAVILMVDSNLQREHILPSERAFAYKMKLDAMRRTSGRPSKENPRQLVGNFETADVVGKESGQSGRQSCPKLAKRCDCGAKTIEKAFRSETVDIKTAEQVAIALGCKVDDAFDVETIAKPMTRKSMREYALFIRSTLEYADENYGVKNPMHKIPALGSRSRSVDTIKKHQIKQLQDTLKESSMLEQVIVLSLLNSGVRRGELAGLTWKDVNFEECTIHISKSLLVFKDYGYQLTTTKESNIRDVDVAPEYMDFLKEYYKYWKSQKKLMGGSWQKSLDKKSSKYAPSLLALRGTDFVICNDHGFPINPDSYGALVRRIGQRAGIEGLHPHMFRHTFVSILLSNPEIGVATVAAEAGHAQPSTTLAIYTQVYDKRRKEIRNQMSKELYE